MLHKVNAITGKFEAFGPASDLVFRLMFCLIFVLGGLGHFGHHQEMLDRIQSSPWLDAVLQIGNPSWLLWLSGGAFVVFGLALAAGLVTRLAALVLLGTLIPITLAIHIAPGHEGPLLKNIAIMGGLVHFIVRGAGAYALDNLLKKG